MEQLEVSLYFHIPFCSRKCDYCHFYVLPDKNNLKEQLMEGLFLEWKHYQPLLYNKKIASIYFGGGTPSLLGAERLATILDWIGPPAHIEITLEANPEHISHTLIKEYAAAGVNRVSIGVQSLDDSLLVRLSRQHDAKKASQAVYFTSEAGIDNISIDLMYDLPNQSLQQWENTLMQASALPITHLSLYNLTIEPNTAFFKYEQTLRPLLPDAETSLQMYQRALEVLPANHLEPYEISAFAKDGRYSFHNVGYWAGRPFIGFGPSAFSYWEGKRFRNIPHLGRYVELLKAGLLPIDFSEELDVEAQQRELLVIRLRLREGVPLGLFTLDNETEATIQRLIKEGFLCRDESKQRLLLTNKGILFYDTVAADLI